MTPADSLQLTSAITLPFVPMGVTYSSSANKLYGAGLEGAPPHFMTYSMSLTAPTGPIERFDTVASHVPVHVVVNDKVRRGYALFVDAVNVFSMETHSLISTSKKPSCSPQALVVNEATGTLYAGGSSNEGECLVKFDADGRIVREKVAPNEAGKDVRIGDRRRAEDPRL